VRAVRELNELKSYPGKILLGLFQESKFTLRGIIKFFSELSFSQALFTVVFPLRSDRNTFQKRILVPRRYHSVPYITIVSNHFGVCVPYQNGLF
jgi:hypothetical protein